MACPATSLCAGDPCCGADGCFGVTSRRHYYTPPSRAFHDDCLDDVEDFDCYQHSTPTGGGRGWRSLWRRLVRSRRSIWPPKRRSFYSPGPASTSASTGAWGRPSRPAPSYDPYTYAQNFDEGGWEWAEPEDLSRSFSARYADPSAAAVVRALRRSSPGS